MNKYKLIHVPLSSVPMLWGRMSRNQETWEPEDYLRDEIQFAANLGSVLTAILCGMDVVSTVATIEAAKLDWCIERKDVIPANLADCVVYGNYMTNPKYRGMGMNRITVRHAYARSREKGRTHQVDYGLPTEAIIAITRNMEGKVRIDTDEEAYLTPIPTFPELPLPN